MLRNIKNKLFLIIFSILAFTVSVSAQTTDLDVNGIKIGTKYPEVIDKLGRPLSEEKSNDFPCNSEEPVKHLNYSGLKIRLIEANDGTGFFTASVEVTSSKWLVNSKLKAGNAKKKVREIFSQGNLEIKDDFEVLHLLLREGTAKIYFKKDKLVKVYWEFNIC